MYHRIWAELHAAGVPREAWPLRLPRTHGVYTTRSPVTGVHIQALILVERFVVPVAVPPQGNSVTVPWEGNPEAAWERAKALAGGQFQNADD